MLEGGNRLNNHDVWHAESPEQEKVFEAKGRSKCLRCGGYWTAQAGEGTTCKACWEEIKNKE